jgi:glutamate synthase (NADPH/NADH) large chain
MVELVGFKDDAEIHHVHTLITRHHQYTHSEVARRVLDNWDHYAGKFVKVLPSEYRKIVERQHLNSEAMKLASV